MAAEALIALGRSDLVMTCVERYLPSLDEHVGRRVSHGDALRATAGETPLFSLAPSEAAC
jgi:hypothetical protein